MAFTKSLDEFVIIATLLRDVHKSHGSVFNTRALRLTTLKLKARYSAEGRSFLTKTLPRLGKALDQALSGHEPLNFSRLGFKPQRARNLPKFMGEFFNRVFNSDGTVLPDPCAVSVGVMRDIFYLFYKYELPYAAKLEDKVVASFVKTEDDLATCEIHLREQSRKLESHIMSGTRVPLGDSKLQVIRDARILLQKVFASFNPKDIVPRHGPGVVATKQRLSEKYLWTNVCSRITSVYPLDEYFVSSLGALADSVDPFAGIDDKDLPAKVLLVPKDSRGPRLISCEPVDFQWVQQGLSRAIVHHVEKHYLTKDHVFFTDQQPNQDAALWGSITGSLATLDLKEASDRVSVELVRLLFPEPLLEHLLACRSSATVLPDGSILNLRKFAPMGSALCFPVMALTIWAILTAAAVDQTTRERILVYGDDVIVPTAFAANAIEQLEAVGLLINRDKSCTSGFFRESCGTDAFKGVNVTPVRFRTVWSSEPSADSYCSWISYANSMFDRNYKSVYDYIVEQLRLVYKRIPSDDMHLACPSLRRVDETMRPFRKRVNRSLQKLQWLVYDQVPVHVRQVISGWSMLLRYFTEGSAAQPSYLERRNLYPAPFVIRQKVAVQGLNQPFSVSRYTKRNSSVLKLCWR